MPLFETRPLRLLHVDDDPANLFVLQELLRSLGHLPTGASSGADALNALAQAKLDFDAVLADIHMPEMDGVALRQRIAETHPSLPVFAVTADVMTRPQGEFQRLGFAGVISKPLEVKSLKEMLVHARRGRGAPFFAHGIAKG